MASKTDIKRGIKTRMRTLFVLEYLNRYVGKVVSAADIMDAFLDKYPLDYKEDSISMNKYIYDDVHSLIEFGYDVEILRGHGIRMNTRKDGMTPMEIELIEMAINSSPMLAKRDKKALRYRITGSIGDKVSGRTIADNIEWIREAIGYVDSSKCPLHPKYVSFDYIVQEETEAMEYVSVLPSKTVNMKVVAYGLQLPNGKTPYAYFWGVNTVHRKIASYRIDRMSNIRVREKCEAKELKTIIKEEMDRASRRSAKKATVKIITHKAMIKWAVSSFGMPERQNNNPDNDEAVVLEYRMADLERVRLFNYIAENPNRVELSGPPAARQEYREFLRKKIQRYADMIDEYK